MLKSLPVRLLLAIAVGLASGFLLPESAMQVVVTLKYILGQIINFCVPLIIIGFIAPSITQMGSGASKMASLGLITGILGFTNDGTALILAVFALQDSFGTACNVTGDGALALMMEGIFNKNKQLDDKFGTGE